MDPKLKQALHTILTIAEPGHQHTNVSGWQAIEAAKIIEAALTPEPEEAEQE